MNEVYASFLIPESRLDGLVKSVNKLANRIKKGKTFAEFPPTIESTRKTIMVRDGGLPQPFKLSKQYSDKAEYLPYVWVTLRYQRPILNGWQLVAVYDWEVTQDGTHTCFVSPVPGQQVLPEYREVDAGRCDHCNISRRRNKSMLITKGFIEYKVVGSSCIKDFLGHKNPNSFIDAFSFEHELEEYSRDTLSGGPTIALHNVRQVLEIAAMFIRIDGYVKTNDYDSEPTANTVYRYLEPYSDDDHALNRNNKPITKDGENAQKTIEWIQANDDRGDYIANLKKCVEAGAISHKRFGILCSAVYVYLRHQEALRKADSPNANEWMGKVKNRLKDITATVQRVKYTEGYYGTTTIITLLTPEGNTMVWFASGYQDNIEEGTTWKLDGTVKAHNEYNGIRQTVLSRVKYKLQS